MNSKAAIEALPLKFDIESITINVFNEVLMDRCEVSEWSLSISDVLTITTQDGLRNLIKDYGRIYLEEVNAHYATYIQNETR